MRRPSQQRLKSKKLFAALLTAFILCNAICTMPVFASSTGQQTPARAHACWPIWPICLPNTPTPTPGTTPAPGTTPVPGTTPTPGATPTPISKSGQLPASSSFTVTATKIVGTNARLDMRSDPHYPVLTFEAVTIERLKITHLSVTITASGTVTGTGASIKTSLFKELLSALGSFANKADLVILTLGGTVPKLVMYNVSLQVDRSMDLQSGSLPGLGVQI